MLLRAVYLRTAMLYTVYCSVEHSLPADCHVVESSLPMDCHGVKNSLPADCHVIESIIYLRFAML